MTTTNSWRNLRWMLLFLALTLFVGCKDEIQPEPEKEPNSSAYFEGTIRFESFHTKTVPGRYECFFNNMEDRSEVRVLAIVVSEDGDVLFVPEDPIRTGDYIFSHAQALDEKAIETMDFEGEIPLGCQVSIQADTVLFASESYDNRIQCYGNGTQEAPYKVTSGNQMTLISEAVNELNQNFNTNRLYAGKYYKQCGTLDMRIASTNLNNAWVPIGNKISTPFYGHYDGQGYTIRNMKCRRNGSGNGVEIPAGLFGIVTAGTLQNITFDACTIQSDYAVAGLLVGSIVTNGSQRLNTAIENCIVKNNCVINAPFLVGGLVGAVGQYARLFMKNCTNHTNIKGKYMAIGGLVGGSYLTSTVTMDNCKNNGDISGSLTSVGGLIGGGDTLSLVNCSNDGNITGAAFDSKVMLGTGGLIGTGLNALVNYSVNRGQINGGDETGGIVGSAAYNVKEKLYGNVHITSSGNYGKVNGSSRIGGLVGSAQIAICESYNFANVTSSGKDVGGLAGLGPIAVIQSSINDGAVTCTGTDKEGFAGGILGAAQDYMITASSNYGIIDNKGGHTGGILGGCDLVGVLSHCGNFGEVKGGNKSTGGIIGRAGKPKDLSKKAIADLVLGTVLSVVNIGMSAGGMNKKMPKITQNKLSYAGYGLAAISTLNDIGWISKNNIGEKDDYTVARFQQLHAKANEVLTQDHKSKLISFRLPYKIGNIQLTNEASRQAELQEEFAKRIDEATNNNYSDHVNTWRQEVENKMHAEEKTREVITHVGEGFALVGDVLGMCVISNPIAAGILGIISSLFTCIYNLAATLTEHSYNRVGIFQVYNYGDVSGGEEYTGGIAGELHDYIRLHDSYNAGHISGNKAGSFIGKGGYQPEVQRCVNLSQTNSSIYKDCKNTDQIKNNVQVTTSNITEESTYSKLDLSGRWSWNNAVPYANLSSFE